MTRQELYKWIWREPAKKVAKQLGVPPEILRQYCRQLNIPTPTSGHWSKLKFGKPVEIPVLPEFTEETPPIESGLEKKSKTEKAEHTLIQEQKTEEIIKELETYEKKDEPQKDKELAVNLFTHPKQRIQYELKQMDQTVFIVPEILYAKDPLIIDSKEYYRRKNGKYLKRNPYKSKINNPLNIHVEPKNLDRALRIFYTIIRVLRLRGHQIVSKSNRSTYVIVNTEAVPIKLSEVNQRVENTASSYPKFQSIPSGKLRFEITRTKDFHEYSVYAEDSSSVKLEDKILNIIAKIEYEAIYITEENARQERLRLEREEAHRKWELEEQRRKDLKKRQKEETEKLKEVFLNAELYAWANVLRSYAERYASFLYDKETQDDDELEKLQWLKNKVEWIDPFVEHNDELLTDEHKKELFWPKEHGFSYSNPYHSYPSWPEFNFWNNPFKRWH